MHRFLSPAAAEAFAGTTPEQVRADLAILDRHCTWPEGRPEWVARIAADRWDDESTTGPGRAVVINQALRYLADQAATVVDSEGRTCQHERTGWSVYRLDSGEARHAESQLECR